MHLYSTSLSSVGNPQTPSNIKPYQLLHFYPSLKTNVFTGSKHSLLLKTVWIPSNNCLFLSRRAGVWFIPVSSKIRENEWKSTTMAKLWSHWQRSKQYTLVLGFCDKIYGNNQKLAKKKYYKLTDVHTSLILSKVLKKFHSNQLLPC